MVASAKQEVTEGCLSGGHVGREEDGLNLGGQKGVNLYLSHTESGKDEDS